MHATEDQMATLLTFPEKKTGTKADPVICHCQGVVASEIRKAIDESGANNAAEVACLTGAGTGCGSCRCRVERLLAGMPAQCGPCALCPGCGHVATLCHCHSA